MKRQPIFVTVRPSERSTARGGERPSEERTSERSTARARSGSVARGLRASACAVAIVLIALALALAATRFAEHALDRAFPPPLERLDAFGRSTVVVARDGTPLRVIPTAAGERRLPACLDAWRATGDGAPALVAAALVEAEDRRFFEHGGVDPVAVVRATVSMAGRGRVVSGASTLAMQLASWLEPRPRSIASKLGEMIRARQLDRALGKAGVLAAYLDLAPWGETLRGVEAASRYWYGRPARELDVVEAATLVAMLPAPSRRIPTAGNAELRRARDRLLERLDASGRAGAFDLPAALARPVAAPRPGWPYLAAAACDLALATEAIESRRVAMDRRPDAVRTSLDASLQREVARVVRHSCAGRGRGAVDGIAVVVVDRATERAIAYVGSPEPNRPSLDAARCRRATGSTLKPFVYALAMEAGVASLDVPLADTPGDFGGYRPENFDRRFLGAVRGAAALAKSRNLPAVRLLDAVGVDRFRDALVSAGIAVPARRLGLGAVLGEVEASPLELAVAYARLFGARGLGLGPDVARRLREALSATTPGPGIPAGSVAWKTGTSSGLRDAWCAGVTASSAVVVWTGRLDGRSDPVLVGGEEATRVFAAIVRAVLARESAW